MRTLLFLVPLVVVHATGHAQAPAAPSAMQFARTVSLPLSKARVAALVPAAWDNSFGLDEGARIAAQPDGSSFEGGAWHPFRPALLEGREQASGRLSYRVSIQADNGSCQVRVAHVTHRGSPSAKGGAIDLGVLREAPPADLRVPGLSRSRAQKLYQEAVDAANARITELLGRFEATLRERAGP